jgi:hypothetical protein
MYRSLSIWIERNQRHNPRIEPWQVRLIEEPVDVEELAKDLVKFNHRPA